MTEQSIPEVEKPSPVQQLTPDWQQIALLLLWKLLPATEKVITLTPADFADMMAAYAPNLPVVSFKPAPDSLTLGLLTQAEAEALAKQYNDELATKAVTPGPGSDALQ